MKTHACKVILLYFAFVLLSGCGFHLRGFYDIQSKIPTLSIIMRDNVTHSDLEGMIKNQLRVYNVIVNDDIHATPYWLIIEGDKLNQQINSISSSTTPRQYQLIYTVNFKLQHATGNNKIPLQSVIIVRELTVNSDRILASNDESDILEREMRKDAAVQIVNRIGAWLHEH